MEAFDGNFVQLVRRIEAARRQLAGLPEDQEWTQEEFDTLVDVRHAALRLAEAAEVTIKAFEGRAG